jgi:hypothetical protein
MTARSSVVSLPHTTIPLQQLRDWARGTEYAPADGRSFVARETLPEYDTYGPPEENVRAVRRIAIETMSLPAKNDPNVIYCRTVFEAITDALLERGVIGIQEHDDLRGAFREAVEHASYAVARAWLRERKSLPIEVER